MREFFGVNSSWYHSAGSFSDAKEVRRAINAVAKAIRRRQKTVRGVDARLALRLDLELEQLTAAAKGVKQNGVGLLEVVAHLIELCAVLLGYDWQVGEPNRELQYSQSIEQVAVDDMKSGGRVYEHAKGIESKRAEVIVHLHGTGSSHAHIALVMNISEQVVKDVLVRSGQTTR